MATDRKLPAPALALALLALAVIAVYAPVRGYEFINFDDPLYVTANPRVRSGLSLEGVGWALTTTRVSNWHPLTWVSHMADWQLFGEWAGGHHLTSVALHVAATLACFGALVALTGAPWPSVVVAGLFALHPTRVESVAWISERKDVLSALFAFLTLWAWAGYARRPTAARYGVALALFGLGLMAKPMLVTLPVLLLVLDAWPLRRTLSAALLVEKAPFLAGASTAITVLAQRADTAIVSTQAIPIATRLARTPVVYVHYLWSLLWPRGLALFYPFATYPPPVVAGAVALLTAISAAVVALRRRAPYLAAGWLWYLVTLLPVIGLVQVGQQAAADRYTYLPAVGVFLALAWGAADVARGRRPAELAFAAAAVVALLGCAVATRSQLSWWRDSEAIFSRTLAVTTDNYVAHTRLAAALAEKGRTDEARLHYDAALRLRPAYATALLGLANLVGGAGDTEQAIALYQRALAADPEMAQAHNGLGVALAKQSKLPEAVGHFTRAASLDAFSAEARSNLGDALRHLGRADEAIVVYREAIRLQPAWGDVHEHLSEALLVLGRTDEAIAAGRDAVRYAPERASAYFDLGNALLVAGQSAEARTNLERAVSLAPAWAEAHHNLGIALAGVGEIPAALAEFDEALRLDPALVSAHESVALTLANAGRHPEAAVALKRAVEAARRAAPARVPTLEARLRDLEAAGP